MKKSYDFLISAVFVLFLAGMAVASLLLPDRSFSEMENRNLRPVPELTTGRFTSGRYMSEAEAYVSDHIVLRDTWVALKALGERITGKQENNGIYFGSGDTLIRRIAEPDGELLEGNLKALNEFTSGLDVPVLFGLIPSAANIWQERLPLGAPTADELQWIDDIYGSMNTPTITGRVWVHFTEQMPYWRRRVWNRCDCPIMNSRRSAKTFLEQPVPLPAPGGRSRIPLRLM